jgi:hypothetical protein
VDSIEAITIISVIDLILNSGLGMELPIMRLLLRRIMIHWAVIFLPIWEKWVDSAMIVFVPRLLLEPPMWVFY